MPTITAEQMNLLSEIFRVIIKEIRSDEDKERLAPGELGISYKEGSFYIRNPYDGSLFSPNSTAHINQILSKYNPTTNKLNADLVSNIRVYSNIHQLDPLGISLSADSIIRQMEYPGMLMSEVEYDNYGVMGFPSNAGMILVWKVSPEFVYSIYFDSNTSNVYEGRYNRYKHMFEGWVLSSSVDNSFVETEGGGDTSTIRGTEPLTDLMMLTVRVTDELLPGATIRYNDSEYIPIINSDGTIYDSSISANNIIMLIYDDARKSWILVNSTESTVSASLEIVNIRMNSMKNDMEETLKEYKQSLDSMKEYMDQEIQALKTRPGKIEALSSIFTAVQNDTRTIDNIENFVAGVDHLIINYNQTLLRNYIDYTINDDGVVTLLKFGLNTGDILQLIVLKQVATDA